MWLGLLGHIRASSLANEWPMMPARKHYHDLVGLDLLTWLVLEGLFVLDQCELLSTTGNGGDLFLSLLWTY